MTQMIDHFGRADQGSSSELRWHTVASVGDGEADYLQETFCVNYLRCLACPALTRQSTAWGPAVAGSPAAVPRAAGRSSAAAAGRAGWERRPGRPGCRPPAPSASTGTAAAGARRHLSSARPAGGAGPSCTCRVMREQLFHTSLEQGGTMGCVLTRQSYTAVGRRDPGCRTVLRAFQQMRLHKAA